MLGFVGAGKSTYLAAAYHVANCQKVPGALRITATESDLEYIESIHEDWLKCVSLSRTSGHSPTVVTITVTDDTGRTSRLHIPDVSGEALRTSLADRRWDAKFDQAVRDSTGILLFVHPHSLVEPITHAEVQRWGRDLERDSAPPVEAAEARPDWEIDRAATDPLVVDLLQVVLTRNPVRPIPIAIIVSAWDLVGDPDPPPWFRSHFPLLSQFLDNNPDLVASKVFGISAQGGRYPQDEAALRAHPEPADKVRIAGPTRDHRDITEPIQWILRR